MPRRRNTLVKRLNRLERNTKPEVKHNSGYSGAFDTVGSVSGTIIRPQRLAEGVGRQERIGDKCKTKNIRFKAIVKMPSLASNPTCAVRVLVLRAKDPAHVSSASMPNWYTPVDEDKFTVVRDYLTQVSQMGTRNAGGGGDSFSTGSTLRQFAMNIKTGMRNLQFDGAALSEPLTGETFIYLLAENQSAEVAYHWRHYFTDP